MRLRVLFSFSIVSVVLLLSFQSANALALNSLTGPRTYYACPGLILQTKQQSQTSSSPQPQTQSLKDSPRSKRYSCPPIPSAPISSCMSSQLCSSSAHSCYTGCAGPSQRQRLGIMRHKHGFCHRGDRTDEHLIVGLLGLIVFLLCVFILLFVSYNKSRQPNIVSPASLDPAGSPPSSGSDPDPGPLSDQ
jgi:hypothetical protein